MTPYMVRGVFMDYDELVARLEQSGNNTRCNDLKAWLEDAGFNLKQGKGNHFVITHPQIDGFTTGSFDCGHGTNKPVKKPYITKILNHIVKRYEEEIRNYLESKK